MDLLGSDISARYEWKDKFCIVSERIWKFQVGYRFEMNFWPKWMKLVEVAKR